MKTATEKTRRRSQIENAQLKTQGDGAGVIEGYGAVFGNVDQGGDRIIRGAFAKTISERVKAGKVPLMCSHWGEAEEVIGTVVEAREDEYGLWFKANLASTDEAQKIRTLIKEGHLKGLSIGYIALQWEYLQEGQANDTVRVLKEIALYEITCTPFPMNEEAQVTQAKNAGEGLEARLAAIEAKLGIGKPETTAKNAADPITADNAADLSDIECEIAQNNIIIERMKLAL